MEPKQLARLSTSVTQALRSNVIIRSLGQAVEECVQNSLDAKASQIFVEVDLALMGARVEDNGCGIDQQGLHMMGNRYCTSKLRSLEELHTTGVETLGFRGEALSSIAAVAAVSILSRPRCQFETYYKTFKDGQTVSSGISSKHRASCGTTVCIRDFLHTESVGRRHAINSRHKLLHDVKTRILRILFIHPEVHFILSDASNKAELLRSLGTGSSLDIIYKTFGAHLEGAMREIHHEAMSASSRVVVSGYASDSSSGHTSRELQYLYINRRPVSCCSLYKLINCFFVAEISLGTRFGGGKQRGDEEHELEVAPRGAKVSPTAASTCGGVTQPRHGMCKLYPIFFINVELPATDCDITFNVDKSHAEFRSEHEVSRFVKQALQSLWRSKAEPEIIPREDPRDGGALPNKNTFSNQVRRSATLKCNQLSKKPARSMGIGKHPFGTRTEELETALLGPVENKFYSKSSGTADYRLHRTSMLLQLTPPGSPLRFPSQVPQVPLTSLDSPVTCGRAVRSPWLGPPSPATACDGVAWNDSDNRRGPHAFEESYVLPLTPKRCAAQPTTMDNSNRRSSKRRLIWKTTGTEQDDHHDAEPGGSWDGNSYASLSVDIDHEQSKCAIGTDLFLSETSPRHQLPLRNPPCLPSTSDDSRSGMFRLTLTTDEQAQHKHLDIDICSSYFQDDAPTNANTAFPSATPSAPRASVVSVSPAEEAIAQGHTGPNSDSPRKRSLVEKRYKGDAPPGPAPRIDDDQQVGGGDDGTSVPVCYKKWKV
jgi:DNA mismatch repair protein MutL